MRFSSGRFLLALVAVLAMSAVATSAAARGKQSADAVNVACDSTRMIAQCPEWGEDKAMRRPRVPFRVSPPWSGALSLALTLLALVVLPAPGALASGDANQASCSIADGILAGFSCCAPGLSCL